MIVVVGGIKGGAGKTMVATNLAVMHGKAGADVLLIDADEQGSTTDFTRQRNESTDGKAGYTCVQSFGGDVAIQVRDMVSKYDDIIIDAGGRDTASQRAALAVANILLLPYPPTSVDLWTIDKVISLLSEAKSFNPELRACAFINKAFAQGSDNKEAAEILQEHADHWDFLNTPLGRRKVFSNAFGEGLGVTEFKPQDPKAIAEIEALYLHLFDAKNASKLYLVEK